jgi:hypothetical protein
LGNAKWRSELQAVGEDFWFRHGDRPATADIIYQAHVDRIAGRGSPAACDEALAKAIREIGS